MVKIKAICRLERDCTRETNNDILKYSIIKSKFAFFLKSSFKLNLNKIMQGNIKEHW